MGGFAGFMGAASGKGVSGGGKDDKDNNPINHIKKLFSKKSSGSGGGSSADEMGAETSGVPSYKKGGKVRKTGLARLHKGERVLNKSQAKRYSRKRG